VTETNYYNFI